MAKPQVAGYEQYVHFATKFQGVKWSMGIFDEVHRLKNVKTKQAQVCLAQILLYCCAAKAALRVSVCVFGTGCPSSQATGALRADGHVDAEQLRGIMVCMLVWKQTGWFGSLDGDDFRSGQLWTQWCPTHSVRKG